MWFWLLMVLAAVIILIIALVAAVGTAVNNANNAQHTVVYTVTGSGTADITYEAFDNGHSGSTQLSNAPLPWTKTIGGSGLFNVYSVLATLGDAGGSLTCSIRVDGKQVSTNTASGAFASANCTGSS